MFDTEEFTIFDLVDESQPFEPEFSEEEWKSFGFDKEEDRMVSFYRSYEIPTDDEPEYFD